MIAETQENAMTEIALAMAMGFFSIMVLTMISMGVPIQSTKALKKNIPIFQLLPSQIKTEEPLDTTNEDIFIVYDGSSYLDQKLTPIDPLSLDPSRRVILAFIPELTLQNALSARARLTGRKVVLTTLNHDWKQALKQLRKRTTNER